MSSDGPSRPPNELPAAVVIALDSLPGPSRLSMPSSSSNSEAPSDVQPSSSDSDSEISSREESMDAEFQEIRRYSRPTFRSAASMFDAGPLNEGSSNDEDRLNRNPEPDRLNQAADSLLNFSFALEELGRESLRHRASLRFCEIEARQPRRRASSDSEVKRKRQKLGDEPSRRRRAYLRYYKRYRISRIGNRNLTVEVPNGANAAEAAAGAAADGAAAAADGPAEPSIDSVPSTAPTPPPPPKPPSLPPPFIFNCRKAESAKANPAIAAKVKENAVKRDEAYYFGLFGATEQCEEPGQNCFEWLPIPIIEQILCQVPFLDLLKLRLVCKSWNDIIMAKKFMEWKKAYYRFKIEGEHDECLREAITAKFGDAGVTNCFRSLILFMAHNYPRRCSSEMISQMQNISKFKEAEAVLIERFPEMNPSSLNPWCIMAMLVLLSETIWDIFDIINCLLYIGSSCTFSDILDAMYCIATFLLFFKLNYKINHGLHYRLYYALYMFENNMPRNVKPAMLTQSPMPGQQSLHNYCQPVKQRLTYEQIRFLNHRMAPDQIIKVIAFAGTGKTSTLVHYARLYPQLKFLNVMFNKAVCEHAKKSFPPNVECRTSHSLAYQAFGKKYRHKLTTKLKPHDIVSHIKKPENIKMHIYTYARYVLQTIEAYVASADAVLTTAHVPVTSHSQCLRSIHNTIAMRNVHITDEERLAIANQSKQLWAKMLDPDEKHVRIVHDTYLKLYQLSHPVYDQYDCIMVDEAQDCNEAMLDIMLSQNIPVILVGDPNQQIYAFRGASNALASVQATHTYHLTKSFRFGPEIAYIASCCIEILKCNSRETLVGSERKCFTDGSVKGQYAVIARTNLQLFEEAVRLCCTGMRRMHEPETIHGAFAGGLNSYGLDQMIDIYMLSTGDAEKKKEITDKFIKRFQTFEDLYTYVKKAEDTDLQAKLDLVFEHRDQIIKYVNAIKKKCSYPMEMANVVFTTAHKSKGLEFDSVCITNDYRVGSVPCERPTLDSPIGDEYNLLYVALTRAKRCLLLSETLYKVLLLAQEKFEYPILAKKLLQDRNTLRCVNCATEFVPYTVLVLCRRPTRMANGRRVEGGPLCLKCGTTPRFRPEIHRAPAVVFLDFVEDTGHRSMSTLVGPLPSDPPIIYDDVMMQDMGAQHVIFQVNFH